MRRFLIAVGVFCVPSTMLAWAGDPSKLEPKAPGKKAPAMKFAFLDLQPVATHKMTEGFHPQHPGGMDNNLKELPAGEQLFAGVRFKIGAKFILLGSTSYPEGAEKVEGIKVNAKAEKLHILHATEWGADHDTIVGEYTVTWDDDSSVTIPIIYGKDVLDWWYDDASSAPSRGKVAWKGDNDLAKRQEKKIRLYLTSWDNPKPEKKVKTIDFTSTKQTEAAPFCVAMTIEQK